MKVLDCAKVDPRSGCTYVARGDTEEEILRDATVHAREHGVTEVTPDLLDRLKDYIHDV